MVKCTNNVVLVTTDVDIQKANFISISCNEFTNINNWSWIFICDFVIYVKLCQVDLCTIYVLWWRKKYNQKFSNLRNLLNTILMFYILCGGTTQLIMLFFFCFQWKNVQHPQDSQIKWHPHHNDSWRLNKISAWFKNIIN
jgi:hypothetical protein